MTKKAGIPLAYWIILGVVVAIVTFMAIFSAVGDRPAIKPVLPSGSGPVDVPATALRRVVYRVSGTADSVELTYQNESGNGEQRTAFMLPWSEEYRMPAGAFMYVSAQNAEASGRVTCEILVDGQVVEQATSQGGYVIATCSGSVE